MQLRHLIPLLQVVAIGAPYPNTTLSCSGSNVGQVQIVQRPPTPGESSAHQQPAPLLIPNAGGATQPAPPDQAVLINDTITCDGTTWRLTSKSEVTQLLRNSTPYVTQPLKPVGPNGVAVPFSH